MDPDLTGAVDLAGRELPDWVDDASEQEWSVEERWDAAFLALMAEVEADGVEAAGHPLSALGYEDLIDTIAACERASRAAIARGCAAAAELARRVPVGRDVGGRGGGREQCVRPGPPRVGHGGVPALRGAAVG